MTSQLKNTSNAQLRRCPAWRDALLSYIHKSGSRASSKCSHTYYNRFRFYLRSFKVLACANTPHIVGKWKEIGKTATLEFWKDGTFKAVDNQKMAVKGKYTLIEPGNVRFEIFRQGSPSEIVNGTVSLQGDVLTFTSADGKEIERYKREK
jgi:hypothetical protein